MKLCVVVTVSQNLFSLYRDQFKFFQDKGVDVTAIASPGKEHSHLREQGVETYEISMKKRPSILSDLISFIRLFIHFCCNRYDVISVSTPKASLLATVAARLALQNVVVFTIRGRAYEDFTGARYRIYTSIDKLICSLSRQVFSISKELMTDYVSKDIVDKDKIFTIGQGSSNGVDLLRFTRNKELETEARKIRSKLGIGADDIVLLYSGRLRREKGIKELVESFELVSKQRYCHLIIQGEEDATDSVPNDIWNKIHNNRLIHTLPWAFDVQKFFQVADMFIFPSYREGFGNVAIEASAMEIPVIGFDVIGVRESIKDGETGILVDKHCTDGLAKTIIHYIDNPFERKKLGLQGRARVEKYFDSRVIWTELYSKYKLISGK